MKSCHAPRGQKGVVATVGPVGVVLRMALYPGVLAVAALYPAHADQRVAAALAVFGPAFAEMDPQVVTRAPVSNQEQAIGIVGSAICSNRSLPGPPCAPPWYMRIESLPASP